MHLIGDRDPVACGDSRAKASRWADVGQQGLHRTDRGEGPSV